MTKYKFSFKSHFSLSKKKLKYKGNIYFIEHHLAHAASTFLVSPFDKAAILTVDGVGEWTTTTYGYGEENNINLLKEINTMNLESELIL